MIKNKFKHFVGIDISKKTFDAFLIKEGEKSNNSFSQFNNDKKGFIQFFKWLREQKALVGQTLICMEYTGIYTQSIAEYITEKKGDLWIEMSLKIIRSMGIQRGKSDKVDSERIALFALKNQADFVPYKIHRKPVLTIKKLLNAREVLLETQSKLVVQIKEIERIDKHLCKILVLNLKKTLTAVNADIKKMENTIKKIIDADEFIKKLYALVISVPGVGLITFCHLLYFTNEFRQYKDAKQLGCYCGVVPFDRTSGTSIRGKSTVHPMANKQMKKLLHTAALCCITHYEEFKNYYNRKQEEGKNNMLILNNIRNKIVLRIASVIKHQKPYEIKMAAFPN